ncbi:MAG: phosphate acyltransferase PlsX [Mycobacteriales bacterium]
MRIALDIMGGDFAPEGIVDGALRAARQDPAVRIVLVGRSDVAARLRSGADTDLVDFVDAGEQIGMDEEPVLAVRSKRHASVRVAASLVRSGEADGFVSAGSTGATVAAALLALGRIPGMSRAGLAVVVPAATGPVILLDAGASPDASVDALRQLAVAGSAYATIRLGLPAPRVGLLAIGEEPGKGDELRKRAYDVLAGQDGIHFVGNVEGCDVATGGRAEVIVTDGFTGNVLLKGMEGAVVLATAHFAAVADDPRVNDVDGILRGALAEAANSLDPGRRGGGVLLGVNGVVVVTHGATSAEAIAASIADAADAVRSDVVAGLTAAMDPTGSAARATAPRVGEPA